MQIVVLWISIVNLFDLNSLALSGDFHSDVIHAEPYEPFKIAYSDDIVFCYRQLSEYFSWTDMLVNTGHLEDDRAVPFNVSKESSCLQYAPYCDDHQLSLGCCPFDDIDTEIYRQCMDTPVSNNKCVHRQCTSLWYGIMCTYNSSLCDPGVYNTTFDEFANDCVAQCYIYASVKFEPNLEKVAGFLQSCDYGSSDPSGYFGCPSTVAVVNQPLAAGCVLRNEDTAEFNLLNSSLRWAVYNNGSRIDLNSTDMDLVFDKTGYLKMLIHNLSFSYNSDHGVVCYVERSGIKELSDETPFSTFPEVQQSVPEASKETVNSIGFQRAEIPIVVDPVSNFQTEAILDVEFIASKVSDQELISDYNISCTMVYQADPAVEHLVKYLWFGILLYNGWSSHGFSDPKNQFGPDNPPPLKFPKALLLDSNFLNLRTNTTHASSRPVKVLSWKLHSDLTIVDRRRGALVACMLRTAVGLFVKELMIAPEHEFVGYTDEESSFYIPVIIATVLTLVATSASILFHIKYRHTVIVSVFRQMQDSAAYSTLPSTSLSSITEDVDGYMPMRNLATASVSSPLEPISESEVISSLSPRLVSFQSDDAPRSGSSVSAFTYSGPQASHFNRAKRITSESSTTSSVKPGIIVEAAQESFGVKFSKLDGDADKVLLKSRKFNVAVPPQLELLRVQRKRIQLHELLGEGNFGVVRRAVLTLQNKQIQVAAKLLRDDASFDTLKELVVEGTCMAMVGHHDHIVSIQAVCFDRMPILATEFCPFGDLKHMLSERMQAIPALDNELAKGVFYSWTVEAAEGVQFLHSKKIVHRDLACRNILLDETLSCKIADFGLARDIGDAEYYRVNTQKCLPFRWLAPEVFTENTFTSATDVWAYGVTVWEIFQYGEVPYSATQSLDQVRSFILSGGRLSLSEDVDERLRAVLEHCFFESLLARPSMTQILPRLETLKADRFQASQKQALLEELKKTACF
ncbi:uncharacterized protein [Watersipora subatra]|uniref:uncharacterized protein n=1 Tax=Watersipora subatra TaxID=2589382 RepID=UPI00355B5CBA